jgi:hypothetical protein
MSSGAVFLAGGLACIPACVDLDLQILSSVTIPTTHVAFLRGASTPAERIRSGHVAESYFAELGVPCVVVDVD